MVLSVEIAYNNKMFAIERKLSIAKTQYRSGHLKKQKPMSMEDLLKDLQGQKEAQGEGYVSLDMLFNRGFMSKYSSLDSFAEFLKKGNFQADTLEDIQNVEGELFDRHVNRETNFSDWKSMLDKANEEYTHKK